MKSIAVCFAIILSIAYGRNVTQFNSSDVDGTPFRREDEDGEFESKYKPDILEDYKRVDYEIMEEWQELYETVLAGYGYLKQEAEDELKKAVKWVEDYYNNVTNEYEQSLYDFEQTYISNVDSTDADYQFLYDIEEIVYDNLDQFEESCDDAKENMEDEYWAILEKLDKHQDDIENIIEITESRVDDIMDGTEEDLEIYIQNINDIKQGVSDEEYDTREDIDDEIIDYYEEDEDDFGTAELAAIGELQNDLTDVEDFDSAPVYITEYEQKYGDEVSEVKE